MWLCMLKFLRFKTYANASWFANVSCYANVSFLQRLELHLQYFGSVVSRAVESESWSRRNFESMESESLKLAWLWLHRFYVTSAPMVCFLYSFQIYCIDRDIQSIFILICVVSDKYWSVLLFLPNACWNILKNIKNLQQYSHSYGVMVTYRGVGAGVGVVVPKIEESESELLVPTPQPCCKHPAITRIAQRQLLSCSGWYATTTFQCAVQLVILSQNGEK